MLNDQTGKLDVEYFTDINCPLSLLASVLTSKVVSKGTNQASMLDELTKGNPD